MNEHNFADNILQCIFLDEKLLYFDSFFTEVCYCESIFQLVSLGSVNSLRPSDAYMCQ